MSVCGSLPPGRGERNVSGPGLRALGVVVPAHDEEDLVGTCLDAIALAAAPVSLRVNVCVVVVLDACRDQTAEVVGAIQAEWQADPALPYLHVLETDVRNVGAARALGCQKVLACYRDVPADRVWLASTDADSTVAANWLTYQIAVHASGSVGWVGTVEIADHGGLSAEHLDRYRAEYENWAGPNHPHVHGTNLGVRSDIYRTVGGFGLDRTGEDEDLLRRLTELGLPITYGTEAPVLTSTRRQGRAPSGFANYLHVVIPDL
jgi:hypothetical protein